jgi:flagellar basal body-associated protein FliL
MKWIRKLSVLSALVLSSLLLAGTSYASGGGGDSGASGNFMQMEPIVVNVKVGEGMASGYLNFTPQLKLHDPADGEYVKAYMPVLRHLLLKSLVGQNAVTLQSAEFIGSFSHKAAELINKALDGDYITDVFFDRWLIQ